MVVCPTCREMNDEDRAMCQRCGSSLEASAVTLMPRRDDGERPQIEIRKPAPPSKLPLALTVTWSLNVLVEGSLM